MSSDQELPCWRETIVTHITSAIDAAIWSGLSISGLCRYGFKLEDRVSGPNGFPDNFVERDTDSTEQVYIAQVNYSTVPLFLQGRFPLPVNLWVNYRDRFAGSGPRAVESPSQVLKTRYIGVGLQFIFLTTRRGLAPADRPSRRTRARAPR